MEKSNFDPNITAYLRQADATFRNGFETEEMRQIFLDNVFEEIVSSELKLTFMKSTSFILEQFISVASPKNVLQLLKVYLNDLQEVSESQQGCHVAQTTLRRFVELLHKTESTTASPWSKLFNVILSCCDILLDSSKVLEWICNTYSSHVVRSLLQTLGGVSLFNKKRASDAGKDVIVSEDKVPKSFVKKLENAISTFCKVEKYKLVELLSHQIGVPYICCMISVVSIRSQVSLSLLCDKIFSVCQGKTDKDWSTLIILAKDRTSSHVIESMADSGHRQTCLKLWEVFFSDQQTSTEFACHPVTNFVIQKLIVSCALNYQFESTFNLLVDGFEDIFSEGRFGVVQKLAEQCIKLESCQMKFLKKLLEAFHCQNAEESKYAVSLIVSFTTYDVLVSENDKSKIPPLKAILYHGSLLLQTLLLFKNPVRIAKSFTEIPVEHSVQISCDASGSHLVDAFFSSPNVTRKRKLLYLQHVKEKLPDIACDKYGSRVLENMWKNASVKMKIVMAESLAKQSNDLSSNQFGKHVYRNFSIKQFVQRRGDWEEVQTKQERKRKMFEEFLPTTHASAKKLKS